MDPDPYPTDRQTTLVRLVRRDLVEVCTVPVLLVIIIIIIIIIIMAALWNRGAIIFLPCGYYLSIILSIFFSSPNLSGRRLDVYHTSTHGVALVRI